MAATRRLRSSEGRTITGDGTGGRAGTRQVYGREAVGLEVRECETEACWREFLRALVSRGLVGVQLAISDAPRTESGDRLVLGCARRTARSSS
jgi:Transposase, Mutator family